MKAILLVLVLVGLSSNAKSHAVSEVTTPSVETEAQSCYSCVSMQSLQSLVQQQSATIEALQSLVQQQSATIEALQSLVNHQESDIHALQSSLSDVNSTLTSDLRAVEERVDSSNQNRNELVNVALFRPAIQSSEYSYGAPASRAVDGVPDPVWVHKSCSHSQVPVLAGVREWWQVDCQATYDVTSVIITNRGDCCGTALQDFDIFVYADSPDTTSPNLCIHNAGSLADGVTATFHCSSGPIPGRYVRIVNGVGEQLVLCEVQVLARLSAP